MPLVASAYSVEIDGVYYDLNSLDKVAEVTSNPNKYKGDINIPSTVSYEETIYEVTSIGRQAFRNNKELTAITVSNTINFIGRNAFEGCSGLTAVNISDLTAWCNIKFEGSVYGDTNPLSNAHHLFLDGKEIKELVIPNGVTIINPWTFVGCIDITSVTIPRSILEIYDLAFFGCDNLKKVQIEDLSAWCNISFSQNNIYNLNSNPLVIARHLFLNDEEITNLELPNNIVSVKDFAFSGCDGLSSVSIPSSVKSIGRSAFEGCNGLTSISLPSSVTDIGIYAFSGCKQLNEIDIPNGVLSIGEDAFSYCDNLTNIAIPNSVTLIDNMAFQECKRLTSIIIGNGINFIEYSVFSGCSNISDVYCYAEKVPSTQSNAFDNSSFENAILHVPAASIEVYKQTEPWSNFSNIVSLTEEDIDPTGIDFQIREKQVNPIYYYSVDGKCSSLPQRGINIIKTSDGTIKKIIVK